MLRAAAALGIERSICMVDFIVREGNIYLLEMTPRLGGDCLPPLVFHSSGLDMLNLALDFAQELRAAIPPLAEWRPLVGLKLFATRSGVISRISADSLLSDPRVCEVHLRRGVGHHVILPPEDYDSWWLGYAVFEPASSENVAEECRELSSKLDVSLETEPWVTAATE
jgi:biotin carboxylase